MIDIGQEWITASGHGFRSPKATVSVKGGADDCVQFSDIVHSRDCIESFRPGFVMRGEQGSDEPCAAPGRDDDDQIVPIAGTAFSSGNLLNKNSTRKLRNRLLYGMCSTHPEIINPDGEAASA